MPSAMLTPTERQGAAGGPEPSAALSCRMLSRPSLPFARMRRFLSVSLPLLACTLLGGMPARASDPQLPNMGSSAGAIASPEEQRQYGFYMLHELRNQGQVVDDALLNDYVNMIGYRLVAYSPKPDQPFTFFILRHNSINEF